MSTPVTITKEQIEVVLDMLDQARPALEKFKGYSVGQYSGPVIAKFSGRSLAYITDAQNKLAQIAGVPVRYPIGGAKPKVATEKSKATEPSEAPAQPVAASLTLVSDNTEPKAAKPVATGQPQIHVLLRVDNRGGICPVCKAERQVGLYQTISCGEAKSVVDLLVCGHCLIDGVDLEDAENAIEADQNKAATPFSSLGDGPITDLKDIPGERIIDG